MVGVLCFNKKRTKKKNQVRDRLVEMVGICSALAFEVDVPTFESPSIEFAPEYDRDDCFCKN